MATRGEKVAVWGPSPGFRELRWIKPVLAGDTIHFASEVGETLRTSCQAGPNGEFWKLANSWNQPTGEPVFSMLATAFVPRRNSTTPEQAAETKFR